MRITAFVTFTGMALLALALHFDWARPIEPPGEPVETFFELNQRLQRGDFEPADIETLWDHVRAGGPTAAQAAALLPAVHLMRGLPYRAARALDTLEAAVDLRAEGSRALALTLEAIGRTSRRLVNARPLLDRIVRLEPSFAEQAERVAARVAEREAWLEEFYASFGCPCTPARSTTLAATE